MEIRQALSDALQKVRTKSPLIHHITNYVTVNDCANITLAIGASPIMADAIEEAAEIAAIASGLVLNIGTLNARTVASMLKAGQTANEIGIPVIFDPVGAGASDFRNQTTQTLLKTLKFSIIRGNLSEIRYISGLSSNTKGVDAAAIDMSDGIEATIQIAKTCAKQYQTVIAITGAVDVISDGITAYCIENGDAKLSKITGTGCMCNSLIASYTAATGNAMVGAAAGILTMGLAGEVAGKEFSGTGSYRSKIIDVISQLTGIALEKGARIYEA